MCNYTGNIYAQKVGLFNYYQDEKGTGNISTGKEELKRPACKNSSTNIIQSTDVW